MTRQPHDQFAKQYLAELLAPLGSVESSREVASEVRQIDVFFIPNPTSTVPEVLGLLGQMASSTGLFEPFRNPPNPTEVRNCLLKLFSLQGELIRKARRENNSLLEEELPRLWILSPSCSPRLLNGLGATLKLKNWVEGVYFFPEVFKTALVAINQLPQIEGTLWLRLLGRGETQRQAAKEVQLLPIEHPLRGDILEIITRWYISLEISENITEEDREAIMNLTEIFEQRVEARLQQRLTEIFEQRVEARLQERQQVMVENLLRVRFGVLDEELERAIAPMLLLPVEELSRLVLTLSREELVERFGGE